MDPRGPKRVVRINPDYPFNYDEYQASYLDYRTLRFYESTEVWFGDQLYFKSNSLGGKGDDLLPGRPVVGIFGDSVVQCVGPVDSWVRQIEIPNYQTYNGGIEGSVLPATIDRAIEVSSRVNLDAVVIHPGWHNIFYGESADDYWISQFDRLSSLRCVVHMTLDPDFHPDLLRAQFDRFSDPERAVRDSTFYARWGGVNYSPEGMRDAFEAIEHKNALIREYCRANGRHVIDLGELRPNSLAEVGKRYFDFIHFRKEAYPDVAQAVSAQLWRILVSLTEPSSAAPKSRQSGLEPGVKIGKSQEVVRPVGAAYPLW